MKWTLQAGLLLALTASPALAQANAAPAADAPWSVRMAQSMMKRHPVVSDEWDYTAGVALLALRRVGLRTGDPGYLEYVKRNMDRFVTPDGQIRTYDASDFKLDAINQGRLLFPLYVRTGDARYRKAALRLRDQLRKQPRTDEGGFWHKTIYPQQMWLDGLYMAEPFYAQFARYFDEPADYDDIAQQFLLAARHMRDPATGLFYHGWDAAHEQKWADPETGLSQNFWGRAMGWYAMGLVDVLDYFPRNHPDRPALERLLRQVAEAVADVQDPATGLWYQVLDQPSRAGNYLEASASGMFVYTLAKGVHEGILDPKYLGVAERGYDGMLKHLIRVEPDGSVTLTHVNEVSGLGGRPFRSGSYDYYVHAPVVENDYKGTGPFIMASLELDR
jgi:unsaturated rhamnogalacturonyl hydrolase